MSVGQEFWIVATGTKTADGAADKTDYLNRLSAHPAIGAGLRARQGAASEGPWKFDVPDGEKSLMFGSFDNLIRLTDDLQKYDNQVDAMVHRLERQIIELDPAKVNFKVKSQRQEYTIVDYLRTWKWDEAKFPKTRTISDNLSLLMNNVNKLDEETRNKTQQYNDVKSQRANLAKKEGSNLPNRDLVDTLTPDVIRMNGRADDDVVSTDNLITVFVILAKAAEKDFLATYETMGAGEGGPSMVPGTARKFPNLDDKDGNSLWRVILFKRGVEVFKKQCKDKRFVVRDFEYSEEAYTKLRARREELGDESKKQHMMVKGLYNAAWSDCMVAWIHIKAMRVFVESVLRFGMPPRFASFIVLPRGNEKMVRKALADVIGSQSFGADKMAEAAQEDGEEYFPYVSFSFTPFAVPRT